MLQPVMYHSGKDLVELIDQTLLPRELRHIACHTHQEICDAIKTMKVRGAPALGIAAAFGLYLGLKELTHEDALPQHLHMVRETIAATRPTAVNLFWGLKKAEETILKIYEHHAPGKRLAACCREALRQAETILQEDIDMCKLIGKYGAEYLQDGQTWLTHCNAGALATGAYGTALGVFRAAKEQRKRFSVFVDETRPLLQGARLTAWELVNEGINATLICDNMAGSLMAAGKIQGIVVGADRITSEGFVANKIGTYSLAVLAQYHKIPFYVAAPASTFDLSMKKGTEIKIEERAHSEVTEFGGVQVAPVEVKVFNPAFDVTPPELVTAIFTNLGVLKPDYKKSIDKAIKPYFHFSPEEK